MLVCYGTKDIFYNLASSLFNLVVTLVIKRNIMFISESQLKVKNYIYIENAYNKVYKIPL